MSLYEQYYSERNKSHMRSIINVLISNELNGTPLDDQFYNQTFNHMYPKVFQNSCGDTLVTMNKELVDAVGPLILAHHRDIHKGPALHRTTGRPGRVLEDPPAESTGGSSVLDPERVPLKRFSCVSGDRDASSVNRYEYLLHIPDGVHSFRFEELVLPEEPSPLCGGPDIHLRMLTGGVTHDILLTLVETTMVGSHSYRKYTSNDPPLMVTGDARLNISLLTPGGACIPSTEDTCTCRGKHIIFNDKRYYCISLKDYIWKYDRNPRCDVGDTLSISTKGLTEITTIHARHGKYLMCAPMSTAHDNELVDINLRNLSCQHRIRFISEDT
jgi:hypothetical protein